MLPEPPEPLKYVTQWPLGLFLKVFGWGFVYLGGLGKPHACFRKDPGTPHICQMPKSNIIVDTENPA